MENELQAVKRDIEAARADLVRAREKNDDNQATAAMMYLASLIDKEKRIEARLAPPPSAGKYEFLLIKKIFILAPCVYIDIF